MKKTLAFIIILSLLLFAKQAFAQTVTPTPESSTPTQKTTEKLSEKINDLKERIASRVAELNLVEKRGVIGTIKEASGTKITITDILGNQRFIDVDEITKFSSGNSKNTNFGISDLTSGTRVSVLGNYNKQSKRMLARFIDVVTLPILINGVITELNRTQFSITVVDVNAVKMIVDIENITRTSVYTDNDGTVKAGFSRIKTGQRVHVVGFPDKEEKNRMSATRILLLPEIVPNPRIDLSNVTIQPTDTPVPTSRFLRKVTPIPTKITTP